MSKRKLDEVGTTVEDASDRAQRHLKPGYTRVPLEQIGFWEFNRGSGGVCPHHVHTVAHDIQTNMTKLTRYKNVSLIEITGEDLQRHLDLNRVSCESDDLMPKFSDKIKYVCATCTHFVHAQKLISDGNRTVWNGGDLKLQVREEVRSWRTGRCVQFTRPACCKTLMQHKHWRVSLQVEEQNVRTVPQCSSQSHCSASLPGETSRLACRITRILLLDPEVDLLDSSIPLKVIASTRLAIHDESTLRCVDNPVPVVLRLAHCRTSATW